LYEKEVLYFKRKQIINYRRRKLTSEDDGPELQRMTKSQIFASLGDW
jgi:hypothetical protein